MRTHPYIGLKTARYINKLVADLLQLACFRLRKKCVKLLKMLGILCTDHTLFSQNRDQRLVYQQQSIFFP